MSDLIDRVAVAIATSIDDGTFYTAPAFQKAARAAIEAMREPTDAMHKAGNDEMDAMAAGNGHAFCEHIWVKMLDAALAAQIPRSAVAVSKDEIRASKSLIGLDYSDQDDPRTNSFPV